MTIHGFFSRLSSLFLPRSINNKIVIPSSNLCLTSVTPDSLNHLILRVSLARPRQICTADSPNLSPAVPVDPPLTPTIGPHELKRLDRKKAG